MTGTTLVPAGRPYNGLDEHLSRTPIPQRAGPAHAIVAATMTKPTITKVVADKAPA